MENLLLNLSLAILNHLYCLLRDNCNQMSHLYIKKQGLFFVTFFVLIIAVQGQTMDTCIHSSMQELLNNSSEEETLGKQIKETRLRFTEYTAVIHNFKGYEITINDDEANYQGDFSGGNHNEQALLNTNERDNEDYIETLIVLKDTIELSEMLFDDRINNTLFEIIPKNNQDKFSISYCYMSVLSEVIDHRQLDIQSLQQFNYDSLLIVEEQTEFYSLLDSASYFFTTLPHSPDMQEVKVTNGKINVLQQNTTEQLSWEQLQFEKEMVRIKQKYGLKDTLVVIPGEYNTVATLNKDAQLFCYSYVSFLFKIERTNPVGLIEKKFIKIYIAYGC
jgi:hypothetical protein